MLKRKKKGPEPSAVEKAIAPGRAKKVKRHRPKVPDAIALEVAMRQGVICAITGLVGHANTMQLDHDPALINREYDPKTKKYTPDANDPRYLQWAVKGAHTVKTSGTKVTRKGSDLYIRDHTEGLSTSHRKHLEAMKRKTFGGTS